MIVNLNTQIINYIKINMMLYLFIFTSTIYASTQNSYYKSTVEFPIGPDLNISSTENYTNYTSLAQQIADEYQLEPIVCDLASSIFSLDIGKIISCALAIPLNILGQSISAFIRMIVYIVISLIGVSPDICYSMLQTEYSRMYRLVASFYSIAIALIGIFWIFGAKDQAGRIQSKMWMERFIIIVIAEAIGPFIFKIFLDLNDAFIITFLDAEFFGQFIFFISSFIGSFILLWLMAPALIPVLFPVSILLILSILFAIIVLILRGFLVGVFYILFPLTIFLYLIPFTSGIGRKMLVTTLGLIFVGAANALILRLSVAIAFSSMFSGVLALLLPAFYFTLICLLIVIVDLYLIFMLPTSLIPGVGTVADLGIQIAIPGVGRAFAPVIGRAVKQLSYIRQVDHAVGRFAVDTSKKFSRTKRRIK